jgi:hypothetical protein
MENISSTNQCYDCRGNFIENEMRKITMNSSPIVLFICKSCLGNNPKPGDTDTTFDNLKLFI